MIYNYLNIISVVFVIILIILLILSFTKIPNNKSNIKNDVKNALISDFKPLATLSTIPNYWPSNYLLPESSNLNNLSKLEIKKNDELYNLLNIINNDDYNLYFSSDTIKNNFIKDIKTFQFKYYYGIISSNNYFIPDNYAYIDNPNNIAPQYSVFTTAITNSIIKPLNFDDLNGKPGENGSDGSNGNPGNPGKNGEDGENGTPGVAYTSALIDTNNDLILVNTNGDIFVANVKGEQGDSGTTYTTASKSNYGNLILSGNPKVSDNTIINNNNEKIIRVDKINDKLQFIKNNNVKIKMSDTLPNGDKGPSGTIPIFAKKNTDGNLLFYNSLSDDSSIPVNNKGDSETDAIIDNMYNLKIGKTGSSLNDLGNIRGNQGDSGTYPAELKIDADKKLQFYNNNGRKMGDPFDNSGSPGNSYTGAYIDNNKLVITGNTSPIRLENVIKGPTGDPGIYPNYAQNTLDDAQGNEVLRFLDENGTKLGQINKNSIDGIDGTNGISYSNAKINSDYQLELVKTNADGSTDNIETRAQIRGNKGPTGESGTYPETGSLADGILTLGRNRFSSTNIDGTSNTFEPYYQDQKLYIKKNTQLPNEFTYYAMGFPNGEMTLYEQFRPEIILKDSSNNIITEYNSQFSIDATSKLLSPITSTHVPKIEIRINNNNYTTSQLDQFSAVIEILLQRGSEEPKTLTLNKYNNDLEITKPGNYKFTYNLKVNNIIRAIKTFNIKNGFPLTDSIIKELLVTGTYSSDANFKNLLLNGDDTYGYINQWNTSEVTNMSFLFADKTFPFDFGRQYTPPEENNYSLSYEWNNIFTDKQDQKNIYLRAIFNHVRIHLNHNNSIDENMNFKLYFESDDTYTNFLDYLNKQYQPSNMYVEFKYYYNSSDHKIYIPSNFELNGNIGVWDTSNVLSIFSLFSHTQKLFGDWHLWNLNNLIDTTGLFFNCIPAYTYSNIQLNMYKVKYIYCMLGNLNTLLSEYDVQAITFSEINMYGSNNGVKVLYIPKPIPAVTSGIMNSILYNPKYRTFAESQGIPGKIFSGTENVTFGTSISNFSINFIPDYNHKRFFGYYVHEIRQGNLAASGLSPNMLSKNTYISRPDLYDDYLNALPA